MAETSGKLILIVDDDVAIRQVVGFRLRKLGYRVDTAKDGEEALRKIAQEVPDLIVSDRMMPGMDGVELCRRVRENPETKDVPFLFLTLKSDVKDRVEGLRVGADDYLVKPFHMSELKARIDSLLRYAERNRVIDSSKLPGKPRRPAAPAGARAPAARPAGARPATPVDRRLAQAGQLMRRGAFRQAIDLLEELAEQEPDNEAVQKRLEAARSGHVKQLYKGGKGAFTMLFPLRRTDDPEEIIEFQFSQEESYVYSIIDGKSAIRDVVKASGLDPRTTMELVIRLFVRGAIDLCNEHGVPQ